MNEDFPEVYPEITCNMCQRDFFEEEILLSFAETKYGNQIDICKDCLEELKLKLKGGANGRRI